MLIKLNIWIINCHICFESMMLNRIHRVCIKTCSCSTCLLLLEFYKLKASKGNNFFYKANLKPFDWSKEIMAPYKVTRGKNILTLSLSTTIGKIFVDADSLWLNGARLKRSRLSNRILCQDVPRDRQNDQLFSFHIKNTVTHLFKSFSERRLEKCQFSKFCWASIVCWLGVNLSLAIPLNTYQRDLTIKFKELCK